MVKDRIVNNLTADLLAAADHLGAESESERESGNPGGFGLDTAHVWVPVLDGGVGVEFHQGQDEWTNRMEGWQQTTIRGPRAYRVLLEFLGFKWIPRRLPGEEVRPNHQEIVKLVETLLSKKALG